jgi:predicted  nucleic acid-binding Zn-ribbon protein
MTLLQTLWELQTVDQEWDQKAQLFQALRRRLSDHSALSARQEEQHSHEAQLSAARARLRDLELEIASLQSKFRQVEESLYGGRVRAPKELENLGQDREQLQKRISALEDQALELMTGVDELETQVAEGTEALRAFEVQWLQDDQASLTQGRELKARLEALQAKREQLRSLVGRGALALYDELRARKAGIAMATVKNGICQICRVAAPVAKIEAAASGESAVTCEGCGRILHTQE